TRGSQGAPAERALGGHEIDQAPSGAQLGETGLAQLALDAAAERVAVELERTRHVAHAQHDVIDATDAEPGCVHAARWLRFARVGPGEVVEALLRLRIGNRGAVLIAHLLDGLLPPGAVHDGRVVGQVVEAVADRAARRGDVAAAAFVQLDGLLAGERQRTRA